MKSQDWFGLGVRFVGLWCVLQSIQHALLFLDLRLGFSQMRGASYTTSEYSNPIGHVMYVAGYGAMAVYFLLGADHLTGMTYGRPDWKEIEADKYEPAPRESEAAEQE